VAGRLPDGPTSEPWPDDFVWDGGNSSELPGGGEHKGKDDALRTLQQAVGAWDKFELHIDELIGDGDTIVALGHTHLEKGGNSAQLPVVHVWRFEGGTDRTPFIGPPLVRVRG